MKKKYMLVLFVFLFILSYFISLGNGAAKIPIGEIVRAIFSEENNVNRQVIWNVRLPRTILAGLVGICLSLSGAILQGVMRNPLAGPKYYRGIGRSRICSFIITYIVS